MVKKPDKHKDIMSEGRPNDILFLLNLYVEEGMRVGWLSPTLPTRQAPWNGQYHQTVSMPQHMLMRLLPWAKWEDLYVILFTTLILYEVECYLFYNFVVLLHGNIFWNARNNKNLGYKKKCLVYLYKHINYRIWFK